MKKLTKSLQLLEDRIAALQAEQERIDSELAKPEVYAKFDTLAQFQSDREKVTTELENLNQQWEKLAVEIDTLETKS